MKRTQRAAALLLCALLLLCACTAAPKAPEESPQPAAETQASAQPAPASAAPGPTGAPQAQGVTLYLAEDCPLGQATAALAEKLAVQDAGLALTLRRFATMEELMRELERETPDLALVDHREAAALLAEGKLGALAGEPDTPPFFRESPGFAEGGFCPLGAEAPVLVTRAEQAARVAACDSLEALCAAAEDYGRRSGKLFLSADSFAQLFACALAQKGCPFHAERGLDKETEAFREVYNLLAGAAFEGGLASLDEPVLAAVAGGGLVCGVCSSAELAQAGTDSLAVLPLPPMSGCPARVEARVWGLAVLPGAGAGAERLIALLKADAGMAAAVLQAGLVPAVGGGEAEVGPVEAGLRLVSEHCLPFFPDDKDDYVRRGVAFEQEFRTALTLFE